jgi:hypothetical protein
MSGQIRKGKQMLRLTLLVTLVLALTGCADHITFTQAIVHGTVGFWYGLWHGSILPFAWLVSVFDSDVAIYAIYNNGGWYDFGYLLGAAGLFGGGAAAS